MIVTKVDIISVLININLIQIMTHEEIVSKVQDIIADKLSADPAEVTESASFNNDLGADSLDTVELLMEFEQVFSIKISEDEAQNIATVGDAIKYVEEHIAK